MHAVRLDRLAFTKKASLEVWPRVPLYVRAAAMICPSTGIARRAHRRASGYEADGGGRVGGWSGGARGAVRGLKAPGKRRARTTRRALLRAMPLSGRASVGPGCALCFFVKVSVDSASSAAVAARFESAWGTRAMQGTRHTAHVAARLSHAKTACREDCLAKPPQNKHLSSDADQRNPTYHVARCQHF